MTIFNRKHKTKLKICWAGLSKTFRLNMNVAFKITFFSPNKGYLDSHFLFNFFFGGGPHAIYLIMNHPNGWVLTTHKTYKQVLLQKKSPLVPWGCFRPISASIPLHFRCTHIHCPWRWRLHLTPTTHLMCNYLDN